MTSDVQKKNLSLHPSEQGETDNYKVKKNWPQCISATNAQLFWTPHEMDVVPCTTIDWLCTCWKLFQYCFTMFFDLWPGLSIPTARLTASYCAPSQSEPIMNMQNHLVHHLISTKLRCALPKYTSVQNYFLNLDLHVRCQPPKYYTTRPCPCAPPAYVHCQMPGGNPHFWQTY